MFISAESVIWQPIMIPRKVKLYSSSIKIFICLYRIHILQAITTGSGRMSRIEAVRVGMMALFQEQVKLFSWWPACHMSTIVNHTEYVITKGKALDYKARPINIKPLLSRNKSKLLTKHTIYRYSWVCEDWRRHCTFTIGAFFVRALML